MTTDVTGTVYAYLTDVVVTVGALFVALLVLTSTVVVAEDMSTAAALFFVAALCAGYLVYRCLDVSVGGNEP